MTSWCSPGTGRRQTQRPSRKAFTCGTPQAKTKTDRITQGSQARNTWPRLRGAAAAPTEPGTGAGGASSVRGSSVRLVDSQSSFGCQTRRKPARQTIETMAATTSTSQGPWKLDTRYCGTAKARPLTSTAGQTCTMPRKPAKAQMSQNGTMRENNGSCRPIMPESSSRSSPVTAASAITGVPSAP